MEITHLLFADDTLVFYEPSIDQVLLELAPYVAQSHVRVEGEFGQK